MPDRKRSSRATQFPPLSNTLSARAFASPADTFRVRPPNLLIVLGPRSLLRDLVHSALSRLVPWAALEVIDTETPTARFITVRNTATGRELRVYEGTPPPEPVGWGAMAVPARASRDELEDAVGRLVS